MNVQKRKIVIREILLLAKVLENPVACGVGIVSEELESVLNGLVVNVGDIFLEKFAHPVAVKALHAVNQLKVRIVSNTSPVKLQIARVKFLVHDLAQKEIDQFIEGVLAPRNIVLAQDGSKFVVFGLNIGLRDGMQIVRRVFGFANLVGPNIWVKDTACDVTVS